jgi:hypothetical protein
MKNRIDPVFLQSIIIPNWKLEYWCKEFQIPFPEFWIKPIVLGGTQAPFPNAVECESVEVLFQPGNTLDRHGLLAFYCHRTFYCQPCLMPCI